MNKNFLNEVSVEEEQNSVNPTKTSNNSKNSKSRLIKNSIKEIIDASLDTNITPSFLHNEPPPYEEVCPPSYEDSFYYPNITFKIQHKHNFILKQKEVNENEIKNANQDLEKRIYSNANHQNDEMEMKNAYYDSLFELNDELTKINVLFEKNLHSIENASNKKINEENDVVLKHNINLLKKEKFYPEKLDELKNILCVEMLDTTEILTKYGNLKLMA